MTDFFIQPLNPKYGRGDIQMANIIGSIVGLTLGVIMFANVLMPQLKGTNTSDWSTSEIAMWGVAGLGGVVGIVYGILAAFGVV